MKKNKELQEAESIINQQKEKINILTIQQKDETDALQKKLQSNKCALDAMKKTLDNEKAFRICADQEIKNLKEQIKSNTIKYNTLENENQKLVNEKSVIEDAKTKISQQCNELIQKNISLENHCEKKELAFDEQTNVISQLENSIAELKENMNNYVELEEENNKMEKQLKSFSKQMETYENEREFYVQRLQKMQKEENEFKCTIKNLIKEIDMKNIEINNLSENVSDLNSKNSVLSINTKNLQTHFTNCLKFLDEIFDDYVKNHLKHNKKVENDQILQPYFIEAFELLEQTLAEYSLLKSSYKESETVLKDEINKKQEFIKTLKDKIDNYQKEMNKNEAENPNILQAKDNSEDLNLSKTQNDTNINNQFILNEELEKNLSYVNQIKFEILPNQKLLIAECRKFMLDKINEIVKLNTSINKYIENTHAKIENLEKEICDKDTTINNLKTEVLKLNEKMTGKDALCNETEIANLKNNFGNFKTNLAKLFK